MIVSMQMAVLPVLRSPMISSRWPRPMGVIESMALMPVCSGWLTGWRWATPGALVSTSAALGGVDRAPAVQGMPSGSITRPSTASPTGTLSSRPVLRTSSPSLTREDRRG